MNPQGEIKKDVPNTSYKNPTRVETKSSIKQVPSTAQQTTQNEQQLSKGRILKTLVSQTNTGNVGDLYKEVQKDNEEIKNSPDQNEYSQKYNEAIKLELFSNGLNARITVLQGYTDVKKWYFIGGASVVADMTKESKSHKTLDKETKAIVKEHLFNSDDHKSIAANNELNMKVILEEDKKNEHKNTDESVFNSEMVLSKNNKQSILGRSFNYITNMVLSSIADNDLQTNTFHFFQNMNNISKVFYSDISSTSHMIYELMKHYDDLKDQCKNANDKEKYIKALDYLKSQQQSLEALTDKVHKFHKYCNELYRKEETNQKLCNDLITNLQDIINNTDNIWEKIEEALSDIKSLSSNIENTYPSFHYLNRFLRSVHEENQYTKDIISIEYNKDNHKFDNVNRSIFLSNSLQRSETKPDVKNKLSPGEDLNFLIYKYESNIVNESSMMSKMELIKALDRPSDDVDKDICPHKTNSKNLQLSIVIHKLLLSSMGTALMKNLSELYNILPDVKKELSREKSLDDAFKTAIKKIDPLYEITTNDRLCHNGVVERLLKK